MPTGNIILIGQMLIDAGVITPEQLEKALGEQKKTGGLSRMYRTRNLRVFTILLSICLLVFYSSLTIRQNDYWRKPILFFERTLKYSPNSSRLLNNLGRVYQAYREIGRPEYTDKKRALKNSD
ncbi:MAG: hypothetical protein KKH29_05375 [Candidatus Omnitrophica bacterium]|nr:hypothetical protein [Candidatus Omnitrophota bacterium]MBU4346735.1 hypothetical protein [Candidatus Omnitrophota bacterium]MBU4473247.1 hypothetical protein [Candidatus Omnitrophota bacterium]MCG2706051.1 hypothetical protein [Candidatus Omnitrophota bacterium]